MELTPLKMIQMSRRFLISQITESPKFPMVRVLFRSLSCIRQPVVRFVAIGLISLVGTALSVPSLSITDADENYAYSLNIGQPAFAQASTVTDDEVARYARAILDIEPVRQDATELLSSILGTDNLPAVMCNDESSYGDFSREARQVVVDYCSQSQEIVESYQLTIRRFNAITEQQRTNRALRNRIQQELLRIQTSSRQ